MEITDKKQIDNYILIDDIQRIIGQLTIEKHVLQKQIDHLMAKNKELEEAYLKLSKQD